MYKLPNLRKLALNPAKYDIAHKNYPFILSPETMLQFFNYMANMECFGVHFSLTQNENLVRVIKRFIEEVTPKKDLTLVIMYSNDQEAYPFTRIRQPDFFRNVIISPDISSKSTTVIEAHYNRLATIDGNRQVHFPHIQLLREIGSQLKYLTLKPGPKYVESINFGPENPLVPIFEEA
jgi:hypothetical protein